MMDCSISAGGYFEQLRTLAREKNFPLSLTFELTPFCNFSCVMCYVHLNEEGAKKQGKVLCADLPETSYVEPYFQLNPAIGTVISSAA